ncbi:GPI mannosyltransferase 1 [Meristemomyces frigidus]|nr:GPI mannosyltransferase 1 [Meristemomyces frigidus]
MSSLSTSFFSRPWLVFTSAILFRVALLMYGRWQDANSPVKYTDIDYLVFTDAARFISWARSPYDRATYRYTPLLAWLLYPTSWGGLWFEFGKALFAVGDIVTGWLAFKVLREHKGMEVARAMRFASIWLLNPMVANISTRGSSEGLVAAIVVALLWAVLQKRIVLAGALLGLGVHVKIYPFIYAASIFWWLGPETVGSLKAHGKNADRPAWLDRSMTFFNPARRRLIASSGVTFMALNGVMLRCYGLPFIKHTFLYHFTRIDHRHNFSVYNTALHLNSAYSAEAPGLQIESLAFIPQLLLSVLAVPLLLAKKDLASTMLAQTFAFVTFNKVCTSQYFLWYMVFLPFYLPDSSLLQKPKLGIVALLLWVFGQAAWLQQGYELEFLGMSTFMPGLWLASIGFFLINCWTLGIIVTDVDTKKHAMAACIAPESKKDR